MEQIHFVEKEHTLFVGRGQFQQLKTSAHLTCCDLLLNPENSPLFLVYVLVLTGGELKSIQDTELDESSNVTKDYRDDLHSTTFH